MNSKKAFSKVDVYKLSYSNIFIIFNAFVIFTFNWTFFVIWNKFSVCIFYCFIESFYK